ncbi:MAG: extracellular solute-binding protein [Chloroflexota bacterium]|nr:extracellular solute-binding protein [Chloroflexota bacterium]
MRNSRLMGLLAMLLIVSMMAVACGGAVQPEQVQEKVEEVAEKVEEAAPEVAEKVEEVAEKVEEMAGDKVQVRWFVGLGTGTDPEQQEVQAQVVEDFNASHDNIELILEVVPYDAARDTLATQIAAGAGPDVIGPVGWGGSNAFHGQWLDISSLVEKSNYDTTQFNEELVKFYITDEGQVGLPFAVFPAAVFYQKEMFDEAGLNYPPASYGDKYIMPDGSEVEWNFDTLAEIAKILTVDADGNDASMAEFDTDNIVQFGYFPQWQHPNHMGALFDAGSLVADDGKTAQIPDAWAAAWNWNYDSMWGEQPFSPNGAVSESPEYGAGNPFNSGKVAMAITHMWYTCCLGDAGDGWDLAALPAYEGEVHGRVDADTYRLWKGTEHPDEAFEVMAYLIGEAAPTLLPTYGGMPARAEQMADFFAAKGEEYPNVENWAVMEAGLAYPDIPSAEGYTPGWNEAWDRVDTFNSLMSNDAGLDIDAEIAALLTDLQVIFDKAE